MDWKIIEPDNWKQNPEGVDTSLPPFDGEEYLLYADQAEVDVVRLCWWADGKAPDYQPKDIGFWSQRHSVTQEHLPFLYFTHWAPFEVPKTDAKPS